MSQAELQPQKTTKPRGFGQIGLRTLLLLTAAVAVWITHAKNRHDNDIFAKQIAAMRPIARELVIEDPKQIAVVKQDERWYDQNDWKIYLPDANYNLRVATRDIVEAELPTTAKSISIPAGTRDIMLEQRRDADKGWIVTVLIDGEQALSVGEPAGWDPGHGSSGGGHFSSCTQLSPDKPVVLFRRRFTERTSTGSYSAPSGPCNGLVLWIEPAD